MDILGLGPGFTQYLSGLIQGKCLETKTIKESANPGGKITISLTYCAEKSTKRREISRNGGKTGTLANSSPTQKPRKKKTPSRLRRDRARFREFVRKKKLRKQANTESANIKSPQDTQISKNPSQTPPSKPCHRPLSAIALKEVEEFLLAPPAEDFHGPYLAQHCDSCECSPCSPSFDFTDSSCHYQRQIDECDACATPAGQITGGLKRCGRCKYVGYCSKQCQSSHWKKQHKLVCERMSFAAQEATEAAFQSFQVQKELRFGHQLLIQRTAWYRSGISENASQVSPHIGVITMTF